MGYRSKKKLQQELEEFFYNSYPALFSDTLADRNFRICPKSYPKRDRCGTFWADIDCATESIW